MEREQTKEEESREFAALLKSLDEEQQKGLLLILQGAAVLTGRKRDVFE